MGRILTALLFSMAIASAAKAGDVRVVLHDGRADVVAHGAALSQVLAEWARVGQVRIENGDRLPSAPVTIELRDVPEATALDTLLRAASGFIAVPRPAADSGPSRYARILILPTSAAPVATAAIVHPNAPPVPPPAFQTFPAPAGPRTFPSGATPVLGVDGRPVPDDQDDAPPAVPVPPQAMPPGFAQPSGAPPQYNGAPTTSPMPVPGAPVPGAAVPGVVVTQPGAVVPGQPVNPKRPPQQ